MSPAQAAYNESHRQNTARQLAWGAIIVGLVSVPLAIFLVPGLAAIACGLAARSFARRDTERRFHVMAWIGLTLGLFATMLWYVFRIAT